MAFGTLNNLSFFHKMFAHNHCKQTPSALNQAMYTQAVALAAATTSIGTCVHKLKPNQKQTSTRSRNHSDGHRSCKRKQFHKQTGKWFFLVFSTPLAHFSYSHRSLRYTVHCARCFLHLYCFVFCMCVCESVLHMYKKYIHSGPFSRISLMLRKSWILNGKGKNTRREREGRGHAE